MKYRRSLAIPLVFLAACGGDTTEGDEGETIASTIEAPAEEQQDLIELPADFGPEGIALGADYTFYVGSLAEGTAGQILRGDLRTGEFNQLVAPAGSPALGLRHDERSNLLYVAGGPSGLGKVYDAGNGEEIASFEFGTGSMINDVEVTDDAVFFTDSNQANLYRVDLDEDGQPGEWEAITLPAPFDRAGTACGAEGGQIRGNGIASTPDGRYLIFNHMSEGTLYRMEVGGGAIEEIPLTGGNLCSADGLVMDGNRLYAVQNRMNEVAVVDMSADFSAGTIVGHITEPFASNPATKVPTTIAEEGNSLYAVTAGFADPAPDYIVRMDKLR